MQAASQAAEKEFESEVVGRPTPPKAVADEVEDDTEEVDESGLENKDIELVMAQVGPDYLDKPETLLTDLIG